MKSDEKASLAPRTAGERAPSRSREIGKAGTPLRTQTCSQQARSLTGSCKTSAKCGRRSEGARAPDPTKKATVFAEQSARATHTTPIGFPTQKRVWRKRT